MDLPKQKTKPPTLKQLDAIIKRQELFQKQNQLTLSLMLAYRRDTRNTIFISSRLMKKCDFNEAYIDESLDAVATEAAYRHVGIVNRNGICSVLDTVLRKKRASMDDIINFINRSDFEKI